ncbi:MAG TPA: DUF5615 family PIN-like protein [Bryobacteraceae bacterium]|nr:DUF5615 family PIN-like protein [Bryobacteraceae bacterium]
MAVIRYQADKDLRLQFVRAVRRLEPGIDFQAAQAAGLDGMDDSSVLRQAAAEARILVSHDKRTMSRALASLRAQSIESPGIFLVIPQNVSVRLVAETLILVWAASSPEDWSNRITKIPF